MKKKIFVVSICLNAILVLMFAVLCYHKRDSIKTKFETLFCPQKEQKIENLAKPMNQEVWKPSFQKLEKEGADACIKIAFIGNSLAFHGVSKDVYWERKCGMAASSLENDYVHKTVKKISDSRNASVDFLVMNASKFERGFESFDYAQVPKLDDFKPDYIVFQLGENVSTVNYDVFVDKYTQFINYVGTDSSVKIICNNAILVVGISNCNLPIFMLFL